jgi:hypothetical protein
MSKKHRIKDRLKLKLEFLKETVVDQVNKFPLVFLVFTTFTTVFFNKTMQNNLLRMYINRNLKLMFKLMNLKKFT